MSKAAAVEIVQAKVRAAANTITGHIDIALAERQECLWLRFDPRGDQLDLAGDIAGRQEINGTQPILVGLNSLLPLLCIHYFMFRNKPTRSNIIDHILVFFSVRICSLSCNRPALAPRTPNGVQCGA